MCLIFLVSTLHLKSDGFQMRDTSWLMALPSSTSG